VKADVPAVNARGYFHGRRAPRAGESGLRPGILIFIAHPCHGCV